MPEQQSMTAEEKKRDLYLRQKELLDTFLEHGAISRAQYDKSLGDLTEKMDMKLNGEPKFDQTARHGQGDAATNRVATPICQPERQNVHFKNGMTEPDISGKTGL